MTTAEAQIAQQKRTRVEAGEGDDHDTGIVVEIIDTDMALIAWDSGVRTPCTVADLSAAE